MGSTASLGFLQRTIPQRQPLCGIFFFFGTKWARHVLSVSVASNLCRVWHADLHIPMTHNRTRHHATCWQVRRRRGDQHGKRGRHCDLTPFVFVSFLFFSMSPRFSSLVVSLPALAFRACLAFSCCNRVFAPVPHTRAPPRR